MFDRTFFHIDEYGEFGTVALPSVLCLNRATVLWSPAPLLLDKAKSSGKSMIGSRELIELVKDRHVRVIAREQWFMKSWRNRAGAWDLIKWQEPFDSTLAAMANEDSAESLVNRRVIIAPNEQGFVQAEEHLEANLVLAQKLLELFVRENLPQGVLEKAHRAKLNGKSVEAQILRDAYNHHNAVIEAKAHSATVPDKFMPTLLALIESSAVDPENDLVKVNPDEKVMLEALDILVNVRAPESYKTLKAFLESDMRYDLISLLCSQRLAGSLSDYVAAEVEKCMHIKSFMENMFPTSALDTNAATAGSVLGTLLSLFTSGAAVGIVTIPWKIARPRLQRSGVVALDVDQKSEAAPIIQLATGSLRPTFSQLSGLVEKLRASSQ